jgi:paraquat-inducible protein B
VDDRVDPLTDSVTNTLADAQKTLATLRVGVGNVTEMLGPDSAIRPELLQALEELGNAGRAVADLAEFIQRNPNALLAGRKLPKEQP